MMTEVRTSAILLASGLSRRMGRDKLLLSYNGKTLLQHAVDLLDALPADEKIIVTIQSRLERICLPQGIAAVINPFLKVGQSGSVRLGVSAASCARYLFLSADQPRLSPDDLFALLEISSRNPEKIVYPAICESPCMPTIFPSEFRAELLGLSGDTGGRSVRAAHPEACLAVDVRHPEAFSDIDSKQDYQALLATEHTRQTYFI